MRAVHLCIAHCRKLKLLLVQVRAFAGWPCAHHTFLLSAAGKADVELPLQILRSACCSDFEVDAGADPHAVHVRGGRLVIACQGGGLLELLQVRQPLDSACVLARCADGRRWEGSLLLYDLLAVAGLHSAALSCSVCL